MKNKQWKQQSIKNALKKYESLNQKGMRIEYCGIIIYFLKKKLNQSK